MYFPEDLWREIKAYMFVPEYYVGDVIYGVPRKDYKGSQHYNHFISGKGGIVVQKSGRFNNGLNFINLYKMIANKNTEEQKSEGSESLSYKPSNLLREVYDDNFFINNLGIPKDNISEFLLFCDEKFPEKYLFKKSNEFQLIDFLVKQSDKYKKILKRG